MLSSGWACDRAPTHACARTLPQALESSSLRLPCLAMGQRSCAELVTCLAVDQHSSDRGPTLVPRTWQLRERSELERKEKLRLHIQVKNLSEQLATLERVSKAGSEATMALEAAMAALHEHRMQPAVNARVRARHPAQRSPSACLLACLLAPSLPPSPPPSSLSLSRALLLLSSAPIDARAYHAHAHVFRWVIS